MEVSEAGADDNGDLGEPVAIIRSIIAEAEAFHAEDHPVLGDEWFLSRLRLALEAPAGSATPGGDDDD